MSHPRNRAERRATAERTKAKHRRDAASCDYFPDHVSDTRHPLDCGNPDCFLCSKERLDKRPTLDDELAA